jgi:hypothetical protein
MAELQLRGYLIAHTAEFIRERLGASEWASVLSTLSPELQGVLSSQVKHGGWYAMSHLTELNRVTTSIVCKGDSARAQQALHDCGRYVAGEATNTFLKMLLKMLTPNLFAKKLPDVFRRDFSSGRLESTLSGRTLTCRYYELPGFEHCAPLSSGFAAKAFEGMGKKIEQFRIKDWSLEQPTVDGTSFELTWSD